MLYGPCLTLISSLITFLSFSTCFSQNSFLVSTQTCKANFFLRPSLSALNVLLESHMASVLLHVYLYILPPQKSLSPFVHLSVCISYFNKTYLKEERNKRREKMILFKMSNNESAIVILSKCFLTKLILSYSLGTSVFYCFFVSINSCVI